MLYVCELCRKCRSIKGQTRAVITRSVTVHILLRIIVLTKGSYIVLNQCGGRAFGISWERGVTCDALRIHRWSAAAM